MISFHTTTTPATSWAHAPPLIWGMWAILLHGHWDLVFTMGFRVRKGWEAWGLLRTCLWLFVSSFSKLFFLFTMLLSNPLHRWCWGGFLQLPTMPNDYCNCRHLSTLTAGHANMVVGLWVHSEVIQNDESIPKGEETMAVTHTGEMQGNWEGIGLIIWHMVYQRMSHNCGSFLFSSFWSLTNPKPTILIPDDTTHHHHFQ